MSDLQRNLFFGNFIPNAAIAKGQQNDQYGQDNKKKNFFENARDSIYTNARALGKAYEAAIPNDIVRGIVSGSIQNTVPGLGLVSTLNKPQQQPQPKTLQDKQQIAARNLDTKGGAIAMNSAWNSVPVTAAKNLENIVVELPSYAGGFLGAMVPGAVAGKLANSQAFQKAAEIGGKIPGAKQLGEAVKGVGSMVAPAIGGISGMMAPTMAGTILPNVGNALNNYRSFATNTVNQYATPLITEDKIDPETWANLSERTKKYIQTRDKKYLPQDEKGNPRSLREELLNADRYRGFQRFQQEVLKDYQAGHVTREQAINAMKQYKTTASAPNFATDMLADATNLIIGGAGKVGKVAKLAQGAAESGKISQIAENLIPENKIPQIVDQYRPNSAGSPDILDPRGIRGIGVDKNYVDYMRSIPRNQSPSVVDSQGQFNYLTEAAQPSPQVVEPYQRKGSEQINFKRKGGRNEISPLNEKVKGQKTPEIISPTANSNLAVDAEYARRLGEQPKIQQGYSGQNPPELQVKSPNIENFGGKVDLNSVPVIDSSPQIINNSQVASIKPNRTINIPGNQSGSPSIQEIRPISDVIEQSVNRKEGELLGKYEALANATDNKTKSKIKRQIADRKETIDEYKQEVLDKRTEFRPLGSTFNPETEKFVDNLSNDLYDNFTAAPIVDDISMRDKEPVKFKNKLQEVMFNLGTIGRIKKRALKPEEEHYISEAKKFFSKNYGFDDEAFAKFVDEGGYVRANIMKGLDQGWAKEAYKGLGPEGYTADKLRKLSRIPSTQDIPEIRNQDLEDISNQIEREFGARQGRPEIGGEKELVGVGGDRNFEISNRNSGLENPIDAPKVAETPEFKSYDLDNLSATTNAIAKVNPELDRIIANNLNLNIPNTPDLNGNLALGTTVKNSASSSIVSLPELDADVANHEGIHQMFSNISRIPELSLDKELSGLKKFEGPYKEITDLLSSRGYSKVKTKDQDEILSHAAEVLYGDPKSLSGTRLKEFNEVKDILDRNPEFREEVDSIIRKTFENADIADQMVYKGGNINSEDRDIKDTLDYISRNYPVNTTQRKIAERSLLDIEDQIKQLFPETAQIKHKVTGSEQINPDARGVRPGQYPWHFMRTPDELALEKNHPPMKISDITKEIDEYVRFQNNRRNSNPTVSQRITGTSYEDLKAQHEESLKQYKAARDELRSTPTDSAEYKILNTQVEELGKKHTALTNKLAKTPEHAQKNLEAYYQGISSKLKENYKTLNELPEGSREYKQKLTEVIEDLNNLGAQIPVKGDTSYYRNSARYYAPETLDTVAHEEAHEFNSKALGRDEKFLNKMVDSLNKITEKYSLDKSQLKDLYKSTSDDAQRLSKSSPSKKADMQAVLRELHSDFKASKISGEGLRKYPLSKFLLDTRNPDLIDDIFNEIVLPIDKEYKKKHSFKYEPDKEVLDAYNDIVPKAYEQGVIPYPDSLPTIDINKEKARELLDQEYKELRKKRAGLKLTDPEYHKLSKELDKLAKKRYSKQ